MKLNKCKICGWIGRTHIHHIIPIRHHGEDSEKNLIELCPNDHSEASMDEYIFMKKHNLVGEKFSEQKEKSLVDGSQLFFSQKDLTNIQLKELYDIMEKYKFDKVDFIAYMMGVTRNYIDQNYIYEEKQPLKINIHKLNNTKIKK